MAQIEVCFPKDQFSGYEWGQGTAGVVELRNFAHEVIRTFPQLLAANYGMEIVFDEIKLTFFPNTTEDDSRNIRSVLDAELALRVFLKKKKLQHADPQMINGQETPEEDAYALFRDILGIE